jgi:hypothetical protein
MKTSEEKDELGNISINKNLEGDSEAVSAKNIDQITDDYADTYKFGWSSYSEITNGRFAMIGFVAIIVIELFSQQTFLKWAGIL